MPLLGRDQRAVSTNEIEFMNLLAGQEAMAIHNAQLFESIRDQPIKLERAKEIEAAVAAKARFLAMMSHEIRTPLNAVLGLTELMLRSPVTDDQRQMAETVRQWGSGVEDRQRYLGFF